MRSPNYTVLQQRIPNTSSVLMFTMKCLLFYTALLSDVRPMASGCRMGLEFGQNLLGNGKVKGKDIPVTGHGGP
jgi:hypothetical protein